jgi:hypothetical protein
MFCKILTYLRFAVLSLISAFGILIFILILINSKDTTKSINTQTIEKWATQTAIAEADNGFLFSQQLTGSLTASDPISLTPEHNELFILYEAACHEGTREDCLAFYRQNAFNISTLLDKKQSLILQYQQLLNKNDWQESLDYKGERPQMDLNNLRIIRRLAQLNALVNSTANNPNILVDFLDKDYSFWHKVQRSTYYLDTYMLASHWLVDNLKWGASMLETGVPVHGSFPQAWLLSNKRPTQVVQRVIAGEYQFKKNMLLDMVSNNDFEITELDAYSNKALSYFLSVNDTLNLLSEQLMSDYLTLEKSEMNITTSEQKAPEIYCTDKTSLTGLWALKYNPLGKMLACLPSIDINEYLLQEQEQITQLQKQAREKRY